MQFNPTIYGPNSYPDLVNRVAVSTGVSIPKTVLLNKIYIIGSMRNPEIPILANDLRKNGFNVFDDWYSPGPEADDKWQEYEKQRGRHYKEAIRGHHARTVFNFDKSHLDDCDAGILVMPAGRSGHIELGYLAGQKKTTYVLFDKEPERFDVMYQFVDDIFFSKKELIDELTRKVG